MWLPPIQFGAIQPRTHTPPPPLGPIYRWQDGQVNAVAPSTAIPANMLPLSTSRSHPLHFRTATVFCQQPPAFLAVNFDARRESVPDSFLGGWRELGFQYTPVVQNPSSVYSYIDFACEHLQLAAPGAPSSHWIPQLLPQQYHWTPDVGDTNLTNAGLIGQLPLIIALAAFSCTPAHVDHVLRNCIRPGRWDRHNGAAGRMVVSTPSKRRKHD